MFFFIAVETFACVITYSRLQIFEFFDHRDQFNGGSGFVGFFTHNRDDRPGDVANQHRDQNAYVGAEDQENVRDVDCHRDEGKPDQFPDVFGPFAVFFMQRFPGSLRGFDVDVIAPNLQEDGEDTRSPVETHAFTAVPGNIGSGRSE